MSWRVREGRSLTLKREREEKKEKKKQKGRESGRLQMEKRKKGCGQVGLMPLGFSRRHEKQERKKATTPRQAKQEMQWRAIMTLTGGDRHRMWSC